MAKIKSSLAGTLSQLTMKLFTTFIPTWVPYYCVLLNSIKLQLEALTSRVAWTINIEGLDWRLALKVAVSIQI